MKLNKILFAFTILLGCCLFPIIAKSTKAADTESFSVLIPKNIDMKNTDSTSFSIKAKGSLNDHDMITVTADSTVLMTRIGDDEYSGTAEVILENAQWYGSDLNADTYAEKKGTITFFEDKAGSYTGQMLFSIEHKQSYNITYDPNGGTMPDEYPTYYYSEQGLDSLPVPTKENSKFIGWSETLDYTLGDYWEIGEDGSLLVSDLYAGANSGPQPKAPEKSGVKLLYRGITFSVENEAMLSFSFDYERKISTATSTEGGGKFYLYKDEELIDEFTPSGTTELIKGTIDYSKELDTGNYQIIYEGYVDIVGMKQGVTQTIRDFNVISLPLLNSIPKGSKENKDLKAVWESPYSITYNPNGGTMPDEYPSYYYSEQGLDSLPVPTKENSKFIGWSEPLDYTLGDYWEIGEDGSFLVSDKYAAANSGPQPRIADGLFPLYREITFSIDEQATLNFTFEYNKYYSSLYGMAEGGEFYLYKDDVLIDKFIPEDGTSGTKDYSTLLDSGNYQIIFVGYTTYLYYTNMVGVTQRVLDFSIARENITSIPVGSTGDKDLIAIWDTAYSITYDPDGGTMPEEYPTYYYSNQGIDFLPVPAKDGNIFKGWGEVTPYEVDSSSEWVESEDGFTHVGEKQLVINFELSDSATLSFDFINQSRMAPMEYPRYSIYKDGSVIIGQNLLSNDYLYEISHELEAGTYQLTVSSGIGNECTVSNILISSEIITSIPVGSIGEKNLTAIWEPAITYSISYNLDGGTIQGTYPEFYYSGIGIDSLPVPVKDGYEFLGWRKQNEKIIELINYDENQFIVDLENVYTEFNYNSNTDSLFESTPLYCITESAETVEIKFKVNRDTNLILSVQLYENEDSNFTDAFHKEYFETVEIKGENNESLEFSLYSPIFFKKGTYTLTMKKGNASQNNLGSIALSLIAFNDYDHISTEEEGDITLNAVFKPIVSDRSAYLDYEQCISLFNYKNIIFCNEPIPGEIHLYGYYNLTAEGSPYKVVGYEIGDTLYVATLYSDVTIYAPENCAGLFSYSFELENIEFHNFDTSKTTNMEAMFGYGIITELDISGFDTSNVENMNYLFYGLNLDNVAGLENLNVSNVKSMAQTFCQASKTTPLELNWNTESLEEMQGIFIRAEIVNVDLSSWILKDGIKVESAFSSSTIDIIKTPQVIPENVDGSFDTSRTYYDSSNNYKEYSAGTFPTGINESHVLVSEKP